MQIAVPSLCAANTAASGRTHSLISRAAALLLALVLPVGCLPTEQPTAETPEAILDRLPLRGRVAQMILAPLRPVPVRTGTTAPATGQLRQWVLRDSIGGIIVRGGDAVQVAQSVAGLQGVAPIPLLVATGLDHGTGGVLSGATEFPPALALGTLAESRTARIAGEQVGREARAVGIYLGIIDGIPTNRGSPQDRLAREPTRAAAGLGDYLEGLADAGIIPAIRIFYPEAAGTADSVPRFGWDLARWQAVEIPFLRQVTEEHVGGILLGATAAPALTGDTLPLPFSPAAVRGLLRRDLGWDGLVLADLDDASPLVRVYGEREAAIRAVAAGVDLLVGPDDPAGVIDAVTAAVRAGRIPRERVDAAALRVLRAKMRIPAPTPTAGNAVSFRTPAATEDADRAFADVHRAKMRLAAEPIFPTLRAVEAEQVGMSEAALDRADAVIRQAIRDSVFPGAALAVGRRGGLVRLRGYGMASREPGARPIEATETLYDLASLTKVVGTTAAVMTLVDAGRLELDAPVEHYLPEWLCTDEDREECDAREGVTIRHLLTHTSGLPSGRWLFGSAASPGEALRQVLRTPLVTAPGATVRYSDLGMILLAEIVRRVADLAPDELLAQQVFAPLGMESTHFLPPLAEHDRIAPSALTPEHPFLLQGVVYDANAFRLGGVAGHAGLFSTARDLAVFAQMLLNRGAYGTVRIFSPGMVDTFTTRQSGSEERALGWDTPSAVSSAGAYFSARSFGHTGYTGTSLWIDPQRDLFVVLLTNRVYDRTPARRMLEIRQKVHDAVAQAITDEQVRRRPGAKR